MEKNDGNGHAGCEDWETRFQSLLAKSLPIHHESYFSHDMVPKNETMDFFTRKNDAVYGAMSSFQNDMEENKLIVEKQEDKLIIEKKEGKSAVKKKKDKPKNKLIVKKKEEDKPAVEKKEEESALPVNNRRIMKVSDLRPDMEGISMILKVTDVKKITCCVSPRVTESLVGDETGIIIYRAYGIPQIKRVNEGTTIRLKNAKVMMFKDSMRLKVNKPEDIEEVSHANFTVKEDMNYSLVEYERVYYSSF